MPTPTNQELNNPSTVAPGKPIRWWPALIILLAAAGTVIWIWLSYGRQRQDKNVATFMVGFFTCALLLLWAMFLSRMGRKSRRVVLGTVVGLIVLAKILFRVHGVTGDFIPILQWRWSRAAWVSADGRIKPATAPVASNEFTNDYPQFMGPNRDGTVPPLLLARDWTAQPPERLWRQPVGPGWSGFAIVGNHAITQEQRGENETVDCYDLVSGAPIWSYGYPAHFQSSLAGEGPRATPTVAGNRVYALGSTGILNCLDLETGEPVWSKDIAKDNQARVNQWGMSCSPLAVDDLVVVEAGGGNNRSLVAYRAATGEFAWGNGGEDAGFSSPFVADLADVRQIVIFNASSVSAHDPATGSNLWQYPWPAGQPNVSRPVVLPGSRLLVSSGYGVGSEMLQVRKADSGHGLGAYRVWKSIHLKAKFTDVICFGGFLYGLDDGIMVCLDAVTGEQKWKDGRYGHGQEILAGDLLLVSAESGEVILLDPNPEASRELTRFSALNGKTWNPPALAGRYLLVRNDKEAACYRLPLAKP
jgi:outer membrane protein assembly factor BamB